MELKVIDFSCLDENGNEIKVEKVKKQKGAIEVIPETSLEKLLYNTVIHSANIDKNTPNAMEYKIVGINSTKMIKDKPLVLVEVYSNDTHKYYVVEYRTGSIVSDIKGSETLAMLRSSKPLAQVEKLAAQNNKACDDILLDGVNASESVRGFANELSDEVLKELKDNAIVAKE